MYYFTFQFNKTIKEKSTIFPPIILLTNFLQKGEVQQKNMSLIQDNKLIEEEGRLKETKFTVEKLRGLGADDFEKLKLLGKGDVGKGKPFFYITINSLLSKCIWYVSKKPKNILQ